jgi:hypothetical protein
MNNDDDLKNVRHQLNKLADQQQNKKAMVMNHVLDHIQTRKNSRYGLWRMSGFALAAAITGFVILPNSDVFEPKQETQAVISPKLSPQMMEDLEMLMVLGEEKVPHGS